MAETPSEEHCPQCAEPLPPAKEAWAELCPRCGAALRCVSPRRLLTAEETGEIATKFPTCYEAWCERSDRLAQAYRAVSRGPHGPILPREDKAS